MSEPNPAFVVAFVLGVTPGKWARIWNERMPRSPLELRQASAPLDDVRDGSADMALLRLPDGGLDDETLSAIPLYRETAVVVGAKGHVIEAVDSVTLADLDGENVLGGSDFDTDLIELVAANAGVAIMPQSVARAHSRRDLVSRPVTDAPETTVALVWLRAKTTPLVDEFIGIVRGRTVNSSRGR